MIDYKEYAKMVYGEPYTDVEDALDDLADEIRDIDWQLMDSGKLWRSFAAVDNAVENYRGLLKHEIMEYFKMLNGQMMMSKKINALEKENARLKEKLSDRKCTKR